MNGHVLEMALVFGAKLILNTDAHSPDDLISDKDANKFLTALGLSPDEIKAIFRNSEDIVTHLKTRQK
ncbi:MAG: hypothetical protein A3K16_02605 [Omnitrophica bacterium RIFCSPLOWO2_01_FULL_45_24]|nr:MAG: hypothetical protein A3K16_02605 [Omnitrophica bacterium RIFCSPLOWO2_01_FULL_45_24]